MRAFKDNNSKSIFSFGRQTQQPQPQQSVYGTATYQPTNFVPQQKAEEGNFFDKTNAFFKNMGKDIEKAFTPEETKEEKLNKASLLEEPQPVRAKAVIPAKKKVTKKAHLTPVKKFLKVSAGKTQPSQAEENALIEKLDASMIQEFIVALDDKDWKVKVRALRGLELAGQTFGFDDILPCRETVTELCVAPQMSLKKAASNFIKVLDEAPKGGFSFQSANPAPAEAVEEVKPNDEVFSFE